MKKDWQLKSLNEICDFKNGLWKGKKPPFIKVGVIRNTNFTKKCQLDDSNIAYIDVEVSKFQSRKLEYGDIILERSGGGPKQPVGRVVKFEKRENGDYSFSNFTSVIRIRDKEVVDFSFLYYFLYFFYRNGGTEKLQSRSTGIRNLRFKEYKQINIPIPSLPEQRRIVALLDQAFEAVDQVIENTEKNLVYVRQFFETYMKNIFAKPGKEWEKKTIEKCFKVKSGKFLPVRNMKKNGKIFVYGGNGITGKHDKFNLTGENIIIGRVGAKCGNTRYVKGDIWVTDNAFYISEFFIDFDLRYLEYLLSERNLRMTANQAVQPVISYTSIKKIYLIIPPISEQHWIVGKLDVLSIETQNLEANYRKKLADLEELRQSFLHKAFAGELVPRENVDILV